METAEVVLRPIREEELETIMQWRMLPEITKYMYTNPQLTLEDQKKWFWSVQERTDCIYFMIEADKTPCGILSINDIDYVNRRCSWAYYVAVKEKRSLALALALEWNTYDYVFDVLEMNKLSGEVFSFNQSVLRLHQMCGSQVEGVLRQHIQKNGVYYDVTVTGILKEEWRRIKGKHPYKKIEMRT